MDSARPATMTESSTGSDQSGETERAGDGIYRFAIELAERLAASITTDELERLEAANSSLWFALNSEEPGRNPDQVALMAEERGRLIRTYFEAHVTDVLGVALLQLLGHEAPAFARRDHLRDKQAPPNVLAAVTPTLSELDNHAQALQRVRMRALELRGRGGDRRGDEEWKDVERTRRWCEVARLAQPLFKLSDSSYRQRTGVERGEWLKTLKASSAYAAIVSRLPMDVGDDLLLESAARSRKNNRECGPRARACEYARRACDLPQRGRQAMLKKLETMHRADSRL